MSSGSPIDRARPKSVRRRGRENSARRFGHVGACVLAGLGAVWGFPAFAAPPESETPPTTSEAAPAPEHPEGFVPAELLNEVTVQYPASLAGSENPPAGAVEVTYVVGTDRIP